MDLKKYLYHLISQIPKGRVTTYRDLAEALGSLYSLKFILNCIKEGGINLPIHRIVKSDGELGDHPWGREYKKRMLEKEGVRIKGYKVEDFGRVRWREFKTLKPLLLYRKEQEKISNSVLLEDCFEKIEIIGGVDLSYEKDEGFVVLVILDEDLNLLFEIIEKGKVDFPYIPTFLAFREFPLIEKAFKKIPKKVDLLFVNGHGISHPIRCGLATYTGVKLDTPTIGITRKLLVGEVKEGKIFLKGDVVGYKIEKFGNTIYCSPGHKVSLETSKKLSERFWIRGRYPEPIRIADEISKKIKV